MFQITINEKGGQAKSLDFDKNEITIGRVQGNDVVLPKGNISKRHSRIVLKDGKFIIIDMQSTNGTYVNGKKITTPQVIKATDKIYIGDFTLQLSGNGASAAESSAPPRARPESTEGIELFEQPMLNEVEEPALDRIGAPGLIDDNFDQDFGGRLDEPPSLRLDRSISRQEDVPPLDLDRNIDEVGGQPYPSLELEPLGGASELENIELMA